MKLSIHEIEKIEIRNIKELSERNSIWVADLVFIDKWGEETQIDVFSDAKEKLIPVEIA